MENEPGSLTLTEADNRTAKKAAFIAALREEPNVTRAITLAGIGRSTVYEWRDHDPAFAALWHEAEEAGTDHLEAAAMRRALDTSDTLAIFLLKARRPAMYRDSYTVQHQHSGSVDVQVLPSPELTSVIALLQEAGALSLPPGDIIEGTVISYENDSSHT